MYSKIKDTSFKGYDETRYWDRFQLNRRVFDPRNLFVKEAEVTHAVEYLKQHAKNPLAVKDRDYYNAFIVSASSIHPDTGEKIFLPFRMASCVPTNLFFTVLLLLPNPSTKMIVFANWGNQTVNVGFNLANANKTTKMSYQDTALAYTGSVTSSIGVATLLNRLLVRSKSLSPAARSIMAVGIPVTASSMAGIANVVLTRYKELVTGINLYEENGDLCPGPKSHIAAKQALAQVSLTRVLTAIPTLAFPPLALHLLNKTSLLQRNPRLKIPVTAGLVSLALYFALPFSVAAFPQRYPIAADRLEDWYKENRAGKTLTYNKGI